MVLHRVDKGKDIKETTTTTNIELYEAKVQLYFWHKFNKLTLELRDF